VSVYIDESTRKKLQSMIQKIENETDLEAVAIINREGMRIACAASAEIDVDEHSAAVAAMLNIAQDTSYRMDEGTLIQVVVRGEKGYTILTRLTPNLVLVASSKSQYKLGLYLSFLIKQGYKMAEILYKKPEIPIKKAVAPPPPPPPPEEKPVLFTKGPKVEPSKPPEIPQPPAVAPEKAQPTPTPPEKPTVAPTPPAQESPIAPSMAPSQAIPKPQVSEKPKVNEDEKKAILEALRIIGMIGKEE